MTKKYTVSKGTNDDNLAFAWQLSCNGKHVQWFSDGIIDDIEDIIDKYKAENNS